MGIFNSWVTGVLSLWYLSRASVPENNLPTKFVISVCIDYKQIFFRTGYCPLKSQVIYQYIKWLLRSCYYYTCGQKCCSNVKCYISSSNMEKPSPSLKRNKLKISTPMLQKADYLHNAELTSRERSPHGQDSGLGVSAETG